MRPNITWMLGADVATDPARNRFRRIAWSCLLFVCTVFCILEIIDRVQYYNKNEMGSNLRKVFLSRAQFPAVTICISDYQVLQFGMTGRLPKSTNIPDFESLWRKSIKHELIFIHCRFQGESCQQHGTWITVQTAIGVCFTYQLNMLIKKSGMAFSLEVTLEEPTDIWTSEGYPVYKLFVHERDTNPRYLMGLRGIYMFKNTAVTIAVEMHKNEIRPADNISCMSDEHYRYRHCLDACLDEIFAEALRCRMFFMQNVSIQIPQCQEEDMFSKQQLFNNLFFSDTAKKPTNCQCKPACDEMYYIFTVDSHSMTGHATAVNAKIFIKEMKMVVRTNSAEYPFDRLLCDIGGTTGLFLGSSFLTVFEALEWLIRWGKIKIQEITERISSLQKGKEQISSESLSDEETT